MIAQSFEIIGHISKFLDRVFFIVGSLFSCLTSIHKVGSSIPYWGKNEIIDSF